MSFYIGLHVAEEFGQHLSFNPEVLPRPLCSEVLPRPLCSAVIVWFGFGCRDFGSLLTRELFPNLRPQVTGVSE